MSIAPYYSFFDSINNEVENFNKFLVGDGFRYYEPEKYLAPTGEDQRLSTNLDNWFDNDWSLIAPSSALASITPSMDIVDHEKNYELNIVLPGVAKENINLEYHKQNNQIVVAGEVPSVVNEENKDKVRVKEVRTGNFKRVITLPKTSEIDVENIKASYTNGVLKLDVPKLEPTKPEKDTKRIEITSQDTNESQ
ncbi:ZYRO0G15840p [Zygosaccharomyces rouxii]|uniref:ZYRO0G15840p n=1 Tax=Zygosaccharomyces rouxii (strain ATCC 2623 / CBS 732 / NBRC 1130 / NCYC 568 / NRRL Y-229) TaxID=559307 RepID=C5E0V2_ZYGRC|nr:uncharacterized protein ZYRO0G15840g [Zygosaccharomyces rouxii]KAH9202729.1 HSP20-like chaperone [Zygosaccharomyces rouxii]CAR29736.1 ZYRO0G15840p [Zygosaccharomyces rouxii]